MVTEAEQRRISDLIDWHWGNIGHQQLTMLSMSGMMKAWPEPEAEYSTRSWEPTAS